MTKKMASEKTAASKTTGKKPLIVLMLAAAGPGIIAELAGNDAGGISTFSVAGASYGYAALWAVPVAMLFLMVVQESAARLGAKTGKGLAALIRESFGIRLAAFAMLALLVANLGTTLSEFAGIAAAMELFGVNKYVSVPVAGLAVWALLMGGSYRRIEKIFLIISLVFLVYVVAAFMSAPNWGDVAVSTVVPHVVFEQGFFALIIAIVGTTIAPWMMFFGQSNVVEKGVNVKELFFQRVDVFAGAFVACVVVWFIIITTGSVLFPQGIVVDSAEQAALALVPFFKGYAIPLFGIGLLGASFLAACVLPLTTSYAICEAFGWERGSDRSWSEAPAFKGIITAVIALSCVVILIPEINLLGIMLTAQFVNGILLPILLFFLIKIINDKRLMGTYTNGKFANISSWLVIIVVVVLTALIIGMMAMGIDVPG
ncbi:MAG: Nramp family divalent metal transporter [Coriobacteriia bacterium]|jgi:NRAMP (natural resistance-associated macrophage protein)-like metal ion transporter|nr:Nramp family divalent metal transporter [Coriobacteriia bacterium]MDR2714903.1 Nramp family divalent metal transporter [Coriobacteriales bacterium]